MEDKQEKSYPSGKIMFYSMDEHTLPCHILTSPLPDLAVFAVRQAHRRGASTVT